MPGPIKVCKKLSAGKHVVDVQVKDPTALGLSNVDFQGEQSARSPRAATPSSSVG